MSDFRFLDASSTVESESVHSEASSRVRLLRSAPSTHTTETEFADRTVDEVVEVASQRKQLATRDYMVLLLLTAWVNGLANGVLPSIQSYSCLPYGIDVSYFVIGVLVVY